MEIGVILVPAFVIGMIWYVGYKLDIWDKLFDFIKSNR